MQDEAAEEHICACDKLKHLGVTPCVFYLSYKDALGREAAEEPKAVHTEKGSPSHLKATLKKKKATLMRWASQVDARDKETACQCRRQERLGFNRWVRKIV